MDTKTALMTVLDQVDYTSGACGLGEPVGGCLPVTVIKLARESVRNAPTNVQMKVLEQVMDERKRQDDVHGKGDHDDFEWLAILVEEVGETAKALKENRMDRADSDAIWFELIQVAATAIAWLEHRDE
jgi:hypothetical protein